MNISLSLNQRKTIAGFIQTEVSELEFLTEYYADRFSRTDFGKMKTKINEYKNLIKKLKI